MSAFMSRSLVLAAGLLSTVILAACGSSTTTSATPSSGSTSSSRSATGSSAAPTSSKTVTADLSEFSIKLSSQSLTPGTYTFDVKNTGSITHALSIEGKGLDHAGTDDLDPGKSAKLTVTLAAGKYDVFCPVGNHKMEGMDETVQVG